MKKKSVYYWSPFLTPIATCKAVINSAYSLNKFDKKYEANIINFFGEFNQNMEEIKNKKIDITNSYGNNLVKYLPKYGKISSRISFVIFFIFGFYPLLNILKKRQPEYLIIHLITSLPLILLIFFNFKTKFILRVSGIPRMNFFRKFLWRLASKKIFLITCPTNETYKYLINLKFCDKDKIKILLDPIIIVKELRNKLNKSMSFKDNFYLSVGRLTYQKNFVFLCKCIKKLSLKYPDILLYILGEGEDFNKISNFIKLNKLDNNIKLLGHKKNIFPFFKSAKGFILSSLWEDPGFVLLEAAFCRSPVFSSDAKPGPFEIIKDNINGTNFKNNNLEDFIIKFEKFLRNSKSKNLILDNLKFSKNFTIFNHYKNLSGYLK